jgi:hypothetical protein
LFAAPTWIVRCPTNNGPTFQGWRSTPRRSECPLPKSGRPGYDSDRCSKFGMQRVHGVAIPAANRDKSSEVNHSFGPDRRRQRRVIVPCGQKHFHSLPPPPTPPTVVKSVANKPHLLPEQGGCPLRKGWRTFSEEISGRLAELIRAETGEGRSLHCVLYQSVPAHHATEFAQQKRTGQAARVPKWEDVLKHVVLPSYRARLLER